MNTQNDIEERSKATASHDDYAAANTNEREYRTQERSYVCMDLVFDRGGTANLVREYVHTYT